MQHASPVPSPVIALYLRVSTQEQETDGYGLESQEQSLREYVKRHYGEGVKVQVYSDIHTGSQLVERPALQRLLGDIQRGEVRAILVWKIDRLSRNVKHLMEIVELFNKYDVALVSYSEDMNFSGIMGKFMLNMMGSIAELERGTICSRTHAGKVASARSGNYVGHWTPYGYKKVAQESGKGSRLEIIEAQAQWVRNIFRWSVNENMSDERIAARLNELGVPYDAETNTHHSRKKNNTAHMHRKWTNRIIEKMMNNSIFMGKHIACMKDETGKMLPEDQWVVVDVPVIVEPLLWYHGQEARKRRKTTHGSDFYLLSGKIIDTDTPQKRAFSGVNRTKGGTSYRRNQCRDTNGNYYPAFEIPAQALEKYVWELVKEALQNPQKFYDCYQKRIQERGSAHTLYQQKAKQLRGEIAKIETEDIPRIQMAFEEGLYSMEIAKERLATKQDSLAQKQASLWELEARLKRNSNMGKDFQKLEKFAQHFAHKIENYTTEQKRVLCDLMVERIELSRVPDPEKGKKWHITGALVLRVGKSLLPYEKNRVRTLSSSLAEASPKKEAEIVHYGGRGGKSYKNVHNASDCNALVCNFKFMKWKEADPVSNRTVWRSAFVDAA